jgi:hypothetical protein
MFVGNGEVRILLPDEDGFDEAGQNQHDPMILQRLAEIVADGGRVPAELRYQP